MTLLRLAIAALGLVSCACGSYAWGIRADGEAHFLETLDGNYRARIPEGLQLCALASEEAGFCGPVTAERSWIEPPRAPEHARMPDAIHVEVLAADDFLADHGFARDADVPPLALAERWIEAQRKTRRSRGAYIRLEPPEIDVLALEPTTVAGGPAFRLHWTGREPGGLCVEHLTYGVRLGECVFLFDRRAPALVYFEPLVPAFEQLVAGFERTAPAAGTR